MKKILLLAIAILFLCSTLVYANPAKTRVLISFKSKPDHQQITSIGGEIKGELRNLPVIFAEVPEAAIKRLEANKNIDFIEKDGNWSATEQILPWGVDRVEGDIAQARGISGAGIKVGVLDSGIYPHEDLKVVGGWNFINNTADFNDDFGHGTHVSGTIAALDNQIGVVGVAPCAQLYSLKVIDSQGNANWSSIAKGIDWAITNKLNILNMSFAGPSGSKTIEKIIDKAYRSGLLMVAAAGNQGNGTDIYYPAKYSNVIAVGAIDQDNVIASFSNTGTKIELVAPGINIFSTTLDNTYASMSGTSMAAPHVSGAAALLWSKNPILTNVQIREKLKRSTIDLGLPGFDNIYGYGLINSSLF